MPAALAASICACLSASAIPRPRALRAMPVIECWYVSSVSRVSERETDDDAVLERDEREVARGERVEVARLPRLERRRCGSASPTGCPHRLRARPRMRHGRVPVWRPRARSRPAPTARSSASTRSRNDILHPSDLLEPARRVVAERDPSIVVADDRVEARLAEPACVLRARAGGAPSRRLPAVLGDDPDRHVRELAVRGAAELRDRRSADRLAVAIGEQVELIRLLPVLDDDVARHRVLRVHARAHRDVGVDVLVGLDRADRDHGSGTCIGR